MKKKIKEKYVYEATITIYLEPTNIDFSSSSIFLNEKTLNCPDIPSITEKNMQKFSKAWETLAKR